MKVFISWSGDTSRKVAEILRDWLPSVIQAVEPYVSSEDIDKGARWSGDISQELEESNYGILCVTTGNISAPWLNFEAGALSKSFDKSRVSPFLFKVSRTEITGPLVQFQSTTYEKTDVLKLVHGINNACATSLPENRLAQIFDVWWPKLEHSLDSLATTSTPENGTRSKNKRSTEDVINEILTLVRGQQQLLAHQMEFTPTLERTLRRDLELRSTIPNGLLIDIATSWESLKTELLDAAETTEATYTNAVRLVRKLDAIINDTMALSSGMTKERLLAIDHRRRKIASPDKHKPDAPLS